MRTGAVMAVMGVLLGACGGGAPSVSRTTTTTAGLHSHSAAAPCGTMALSSTHYDHVIWVWMENHSYDSIIGSPDATYINQLAHSCGLATNYHNVSHPSLPNYVAATSGLPLASLAPFTSDCDPSPACSAPGPSIFSQGESWKAYEESMPANCDKDSAGEYAVRHNPPAYFSSLLFCKPRSLTAQAPAVSFDVPYTELASDIAADTLPAFAFVTPNLVDDMHDGTVAEGDEWLATNLPSIFSSPQYTSGHVAVFVTWDEGEGGASSDCATNTTDAGCHVATIVASPSTTATSSGTLFNHYSLLHTAEQLLGLPLLGQAAGATSMVSAFNL
ncbi:MAG TPA: alkaline phosphatase family protein [Acidimicrobiales bacterium]|nr:alkaline phosphatase family protein [Acidimicrobiales bacterium]